MKNLIAAVLLLMCGSVQAATITIDFDDLPLGGTPLPGGFLVEVITEGYSFISNGGVDNPGGNKVILGFATDNGAEGIPGEIFISRQDGAAFALYAAEFLLAGGGAQAYFASSDNGNFSNFGSSTGPGLDELGTGAWLNINGVSFLSGAIPFQAVLLDSVIVGDAVPIPAAVWMFGSGLGFLGWMKRK